MDLLQEMCFKTGFRAIKDILTDHTIMETDLTKSQVWLYIKCIKCGQEAINFTCKAAKDYYDKTVICERCSGKEFC